MHRLLQGVQDGHGRWNESFVIGNFFRCTKETETGTYTVCVFHPGALSILFIDANTNDSPDHSLASSHAACLVALLGILREPTTEEKSFIIEDSPGK